MASDGGSGAPRALARQRQDRILAELRVHGAVRVSELTELLGVSDMTVRRDLDVLAEAGLLEKVHGGATRAEGRSTDEPGFEAKSLRETTEKAAIAQRAAQLVRPGMAVGLTAGTTTWHLAQQFAEIADLTVVTNSMRIATLLHERPRPDLTVVVTGGVRTPSDALVGPLALAALGTLHLDLVFMGVHGMSERAGFTTPNLNESQTNRAFVEAAHRLVVVADHTKWGITGLSSIARLDEAQVLVTDSGLSSDARDTLRTYVGELLLAHPDGAPGLPDGLRSLTSRGGP